MRARTERAIPSASISARTRKRWTISLIIWLALRWEYGAIIENKDSRFETVVANQDSEIALLARSLEGYRSLVDAGAIAAPDSANHEAINNASEEGPLTILTNQNPKFISGFPAVPNEKVIVNVSFKNSGTAVASDVGWWSATKLVDAPKADAEENRFLDQFSNEIDVVLDQIHAADFAPGEGAFRSLGLTYSAEDLIGIKEGTKRIYFLSKSVWRDPHGVFESERCLYLSPPGNQQSWVGCRSHNHIRHKEG